MNKIQKKKYQNLLQSMLSLPNNRLLSRMPEKNYLNEKTSTI